MKCPFMSSNDQTQSLVVEVHIRQHGYRMVGIMTVDIAA